MKKTGNIFLTLFFVFFCGTAFSQDVVGKWKTIDDESGKARSIVELYRENGKIYGKVLEILNPKKKLAVCKECPGDKKGMPIEGLVILEGLQKDGNEYTGGTVMDPSTGKIYRCYIALEETNKLKVRGYIGFSLIGRTQYWLRVK